MDPEDISNSGDPKPRVIPADLPRSLNDRRHAPVEDYVPETEMYDGWQGERGEKQSNTMRGASKSN